MHFAPWTDHLALDIAMSLEKSGDPIVDILARHSLKQSDLVAYSADPVFSRRVEGFRKELRDGGLSFKLKAKAQAEELLTTSWVLIHAPDTSPAVKADLIKSTVKWAGYESKDEAGGNNPNNGVSITINLGGPDKPSITNVTGTTPQLIEG